MAILYLPKEKYNAWLAKLNDTFTVFYPDLIKDKVHYKKLSKKYFDDPYYAMDKALEKIRPAEALKGFLYRPKEKVGGLENKSSIELKTDSSPQIIIGAKNCDLRPLMVHQKMYLENEFGEPFYKSQRERTIIVAVDCPKPETTCFCNLLGLKPYPEKGADIILSVLPSGYVFETITDAGEKLLRDNDHLFQEAGSNDIATRDQIRNSAVKTLESINPKKWREDLAEAIEKNNDEKFWNEGCKTCVECYGCLMVCPTCFCFLLYDTPTGNEGFLRHKVWDACYYAAYARVGGGGNSRPEFWKRFQNRFHCKFMTFPNDYGFNACSGCGRCFSVCMGKIDIRKILEKL